MRLGRFTFRSAVASFTFLPASSIVTPASSIIAPTSFIITVARYTFTPPSSKVTPTSYKVAPASSNVAAACFIVTPPSFINRVAYFVFYVLFCKFHCYNNIKLFTMAKIVSVNPFNIDVLKSCKGYVPKFVDGKTNVSLDILNTNQKKDLPTVVGNSKKLLNYTNLSIWFNKKRKVPFVSAYNIDGSQKKDVSRQSVNFNLDPRISKSIQLEEKVFYALVTNLTEFEIGHMASHNEMAWGTTLDSKVRSHQTFHYTNSVPQVERLNTGLWSKLESYVIKESKESGSEKISVFTGPMLKDTDPTYLFDNTYKVPLFFFKIVVFLYNDQLYTTGYVMSQYKRAIELGLIAESTKPVLERKAIAEIPVPFSDYNHKDVFQVDIELIEKYTGLNFNWPKVNRIAVPNGQNKLEEIAETGGTKEAKRFKTLAGLNESEDSPIKGTVTNMILPSKV